MPKMKMFPPLSEDLGDTEQDRFKNFAKALLSVPKAEAIEQGARTVSVNLPTKHSNVVVHRLEEPISEKATKPKRKAAKKRK